MSGLKEADHLKVTTIDLLENGVQKPFEKRGGSEKPYE